MVIVMERKGKIISVSILPLLNCVLASLPSVGLAQLDWDREECICAE